MIQGARRGIGRALADTLLADGSIRHLFATARDVDAAGLCESTARGGDSVHPLALDITDEASVAQAGDRIAGVVDQLDLVITCAGVRHNKVTGMRPEKRLADVDPDQAARAFQVNATRPLLLLKHVSPMLLHGQRAVFASISARVGSIADNGLGGCYTYRASKAAQNQFTRTAAIELRRKSQQAICVGRHPGTTDTALSEPFQRNVPQGKLFSPEFSAEQLLSVLSGLTPQDSGNVLAWDGQRVPE